MGSWDQFTDWLMKGNQVACYEMVISVRDSSPDCLAMRKKPPSFEIQRVLAKKTLLERNHIRKIATLDSMLVVHAPLIIFPRPG